MAAASALSTTLSEWLERVAHLLPSSLPTLPSLQSVLSRPRHLAAAALAAALGVAVLRTVVRDSGRSWCGGSGVV